MKIKLAIIITVILALGATAAWGQNWQFQYLSQKDNGRLYRVSSELEDPGPREFGRYGGHNLFDQNPATCWAEGAKGPGLGEYVFVEVRPGERNIHILNGYHKSQALFEKNNRVKDMVLSMYVAVYRPDKTTEIFEGYDIMQYGEAKRVTLQDSMSPQVIRFRWDWNDIERFSDQNDISKAKTRDLAFVPQDMQKKYLLRLEITDVYRGSKYDDTCISEVWMSR